jgi:hypothetical protein
MRLFSRPLREAGHALLWLVARQRGLDETFEGRVGESVIGRKVRRSHAGGSKMGSPVGLSLEPAAEFRQPFALQRLDGRMAEPFNIDVKH